MVFGTEIAARIAANYLDALDVPVARVAAEDRVWCGRCIRNAVLPATHDLYRAIDQAIRY